MVGCHIEITVFLTFGMPVVIGPYKPFFAILPFTEEATVGRLADVHPAHGRYLP